uniref:Proteasome assembly chaperone 1 n=1 Tax=Steinernema glaseri TaxID=37863 RepID=A0A1I8AC27_9BILA
MDRVPLLFVQEVLLLLDRTHNLYRNIPQYPSTWGSVADRRGVKRHTCVTVYLRKNPVFSIWTSRTAVPVPVPLKYLDHYPVEEIQISKKSEQGMRICHPMTKANLQLLQRHFRRGHPCELTVCANFIGVAPVEQLFSTLSRLTELYLHNRKAVPMEILTQSIHRGTLSRLICSIDVHVSEEFLPVLLRFVASEQFEVLAIASSSGPVSSEVFLKEAIDAFLSRPRRKKFSFFILERHRDLCGRLTEEDVREKVKVVFGSETLLSVNRSKSY